MQVEKEIDELKVIWDIKKNWDQKWIDYKEIQFETLAVDLMEGDAEDELQKLRELSKDQKEYKVYEYVQNELKKFVQTMPIIKSIQEPYMRNRHWKELRYEVKDDFDEKGEDFTLEYMFKLNLTEYEDKISELTDRARKQLAIETGLNLIEKKWTEEEKSNLDV
jgi:dynein heavy chain